MGPMLPATMDRNMVKERLKRSRLCSDRYGFFLPTNRPLRRPARRRETVNVGAQPGRTCGNRAENQAGKNGQHHNLH